MKRDFGSYICSVDGFPITTQGGIEALAQAIQVLLNMMPEEKRAAADKEVAAILGAPLRLQDVCVAALLSATPDDKPTDIQAMERMELARKVYKGGVLEITSEQAVLMKKLIRQRYGGVVIPVVAGELLDRDMLSDAAET